MLKINDFTIRKYDIINVIFVAVALNFNKDYSIQYKTAQIEKCGFESSENEAQPQSFPASIFHVRKAEYHQMIRNTEKTGTS